MKRAQLVAALLLTAAVPWTAAASVSVVEIMYDAPGADTRREWVEFKTDSPIVDIRTWRFVEGGVRHKITGTDGGVPAGARFVLAADAPTFRAEHPEYTGLVFDTAMSLSNSGETITLENESRVVMLMHAYVSAPKPAPVVEKKVTTNKKPKAEPRVLGAETSDLEERSQQVATAVEATSPVWAWFSFLFLGLIVLSGLCTLLYLQFKK